MVRKSKVEGEVRRWRLDHPNGHDIVRQSGGGWKCRTCGRTTKSLARAQQIARKACARGLAARAHPSHRLALTGVVLWCRRCGAYSQSKLRGLADACMGHARSSA
jgi:hypothetical protein